MTESTNPSAIRSQTEITEALLTLMRKYPYNEITVKQVILEAKLARKTFYRNFDSKDDVLLSMIRAILLEYFDIVNNAKSDVLTTIFAFARKHSKLLLLLDKNDMLYILLKYMNGYAPYFAARQNKQLNPFSKLFDGLDSDYLIAMNMGAVWNIISLWIHRGMTDDPDMIKAMIEQYLQRISEI